MFLEVVKGNFEGKAETNILELNSENFEATVQSFPFLFVQFYAPWCAHCRKFVPKYEKIAKTLKEKYPYIGIAQIDADLYFDIGLKFNIEKYPELKLFRHGQPVDYNFDRGEEDIID